VPRPLEETFAFFSDAHNLEAITPRWLRFRILEAPAELEQGSLIRYQLRLFGVPISWHAEIGRWTPPRSFTDVQTAGPYPLWEHTHRFSPVRDGTEIYDHVRYRVPGGPLGPLVQRVLVRRWLDQIFDYRAARLDELLSLRGGTSTEKSKRSA
jgi:ligand-binding SRPBCC domain-containing protein